MEQHIQETQFESIIDEIKYEFQDVINLLNHIFGVRNQDLTGTDLLNDHVQRPANDNWPIIKTKNDKTIKINVL